VPIANRFGFYWGGHYQSRMDGMHFEIAVLQRKVISPVSSGQAVAGATVDSTVTHDIAASAIETPPLPVAESPPAASA